MWLCVTERADGSVMQNLNERFGGEVLRYIPWLG